MYTELAVFALFVFCYSLVAGRLEREKQTFNSKHVLISEAPDF